MRKLCLLLTVFCLIAANVGCAPEDKPKPVDGGANPAVTPEGGGSGTK